ncbi:IS1380 family transposase [Streptomyces mirabilis]|uniref:IS1380 family transposase n=1 Tax=Streptomyces mirabilis TaxID=68239 RepID=UPI00371C9D4D
MKKRIGSYPRVRIEGGGRGVSQAGGVLLVETIRKTGLDQAISAALAPWRKPRAVHDPGKILLDVALAVALGGDCLADAGMLRAEPAVFGPVASDPTLSRLIDSLAAAGPKTLTAIRTGRAQVRESVWKLAGAAAPDAGGQVTVGLDGVLVIAHSDMQDAAPTWKRTYGHHPLMAFADHGPGGTGEPVAVLHRPGNAGSNTASDHITTTRLALAQLPKEYRRGRQTLLRTDSAGGTRGFVAWLANQGRWLSYSVGMVITDAIHQHVLKVPASTWTPAVEADGEIRDGAWVAELTGDVLTGWPTGMRFIVRQIALDLLAWMPMLALTGRARLWEPRRLRLRLFTTAGQLVTTGRRRILRLAAHWPWTLEITAALDRLAQLRAPD